MGRTKALIEIDGVPMATRVAAALRSAGCVEVVACGGDHAELAPLGLPVLPDRHPGSGPLGAVLGVLEQLDRQEAEEAGMAEVAGVFVVACDLPALTGDSLADMVRAALDRPEFDVIVARTSVIEPVCAIWRRTAVEPLRRCFEEGERALHVAIGRLDSFEVVVDSGALRNINTPDELGRYP
jgi:molybdopterin-guanine dinucleotide biosynthesis protein A